MLQEDYAMAKFNFKSLFYLNNKMFSEVNIF